MKEGRNNRCRMQTLALRPKQVTPSKKRGLQSPSRYRAPLWRGPGCGPSVCVCVCVAQKVLEGLQINHH